MIKYKTVAKVGMAVAMALMPVLVLAQLPPAGALPTPTSPYAGNPITLTDVQDIIESVATFLIVISVIVAVIFIVWGGMMYMMAGDDASKSGAAKTRIVNGIIGALVVLAVGLILQTLASLVDFNTFFG